jgi:superfamily II RNA helicase
MDREELQKNIDELLKQRYELEEKLSQSKEITFEEKEVLYQSFKKNFEMLLQIERVTKEMEVQEWWIFIKQWYEKLNKS